MRVCFCNIFRMANGDSTAKSFGNNQEDNDSEPEQSSHLELDLGDDSSHNRESNRLDNHKVGASGSNSSFSDGQKREENPFSFKHFLRSDSGNNYLNKGARPKVYPESRSSSSDFSNHVSETKQPRIAPEFSSALPDFVQDHLVIEQCYLGSHPNSNYNLDIDNLPDFTPSRENRNSYEDAVRETPESNARPVPLDLPVRPPDDFPLDLPVPGSSVSGSRNGLSVSEVGNSKSLPDFLADSAVCAQKCETLSVPHSPEGEVERLRHELDITKRQLAEKSRLCDCLSRELEIARNKEHEYTQNLAKALEQVESNLEKSNRRATSSESTVLKLKQEIKTLTSQLNSLKAENRTLRGDEAAGGQGYYNPSNELHSYRLAQELRGAASTAEHSLRQLLTGVDNLRMMAASLENMHRIEEKSDHFTSFDEDAGPAL
nr:serologically defined colon cancer antigen 3 homolog [Leptinotarsa decemlineata]